MRIWILILLIIGLGLSLSLRNNKNDSPTPEKVLVIAAAGDIACDADWEATDKQCQQAATAKLIMEIKPDIVLALGDLHYTTDSIDDFSGYEQSWGKYKAITRPVLGNHEYLQSEKAGKYFDYWGETAGSPGKGWYSFERGNWRFSALNTNCDEIDCGKDGEEAKWLADDLKTTTQKCILAFMHQPRYSSGKQHGDSVEVAQLWQILNEYGVDIVLAGHEHNYESMFVDGMREIVAGTGGRSLYEFGVPKTGSEARLSKFGVVKLTLGDNEYKWEFITTQGTVEDSGSGKCR